MSFELHQSDDFLAHRTQLFSAAELGKIDDERTEHDLGAGALEKPDRRRRGAAGRNKVIDDKDLFAFGHGVYVNLNLIDAVFEFVALADRLVGKLALLADRHEPDRQLMGDRAAENETARLDAGDLVDLGARKRLDKFVDRAPKAARVGKQRCHVAEDNTGLWVVRDRADDRAKVHEPAFVEGGGKMAESRGSDKPAPLSLRRATACAPARVRANEQARSLLKDRRVKKFLLLTAALVAPAILVAGCGRKQADAPVAVEPARDPNAPEIGTFGLAVKDIDASVAPGDDFYAYVNGDWLKSFKIPEEYSSYGSFTVLAERSEQRLKDIIEGLSATAAGGDAARVRDFYQSYLDVAAIEAKGLAPLTEDFAAIDRLATPDDLARFFADPAIRGRSPIALIISADLKRPDRYALYVGQSGLGMPNRDYYLDEKFADKQAKYQTYIETMLRLAGVEDPAGAAARIYGLELEMAKVHWEPAKRRNRDLMYNLKSIEQLESFAPGAPWRTMLGSAGLDGRAEVIVREDDAVQKLAAMIPATPIGTWREYLKFHLINASADVLPPAFDDANFAFFGTELRGTPKQKERWKRAVAAVDNSIGEAVGKLYVEKHFPPESKAMMEELVANLRTALDERIGTLTWMSDATRAAARDKLNKFTAKIGYPDEWRDYGALDVRAGDAYGNAKRAQAFEWTYEVARIDGPVDRKEWGMTPQTVNAYYNPPFNEIVFPAAILEAPFFDSKADAAVNYGAIGAVIGHEIGHGFDDQGRKSDGDGVLRDWWSAADVAAFQKLADKIGAQYSAYEPLPGFKVNPQLTMGENIGDIGGLAMAYHAYKLSLQGAEAPVIDGLTGDQRFFLAWGQVWKRAVRDEQLKNQIATDSHSPAKYRVNGVVRNMNAWYDAFGVTKENDLWLDPKDRVEIW